VWEFQGDWIHGNPDLYDETAGCFNRTYKEKREKDQKKKEFYESQGFKVIIMWESEWTKEKKELKRNNQTWL
jgi:G:T-mismatch repair DNA endonuclease (very short patch repair protein)